ncbi:uncharacterized protein [Typha latifolia]|uniref:uncharacterized protein isoform X1 n=1 Tax=Typha latifolia TaxID=4733 RepID=UPI003C2FF9F2
MSLVRSFASYYRRNVCLLGHPGNRTHDLGLATLDQRRYLSGNRHSKIKTKMETIADQSDKKPKSSRLPSRLSFFTWARWTFGSILTILLPLWHNKWMGLLQIEGEVEMVADVVENTAEVVEKVATMAEKLSSDMADRLPEDTKLKEAAVFVERASKEIAEEAQLAQDIIHKVDKLVEEVETFLDPITEHGKKVKVERGNGVDRH